MSFRQCYLIFWVIIICAVYSFCGREFNWSVNDYARYNFRTFSGFAAARQRIDFNNIDYKLLHAAIFYQTNLARNRYNLPSLQHLPALEQVAFEHSKDMVQYDFFSHISPVANKTTVRDRAALSDIDFSILGENIANVSGLEYQSGRPVYTPPQNGGYFSYTPNGQPLKNRTYLDLAIVVVDELMDSKGHRENILDPRFTFLGTGAAFFYESNFYDMAYFVVTQVFSSE
ncbi:CAP domain-containing protein [candidate division KSB1 bacterium]|nr:CAP domain-containing protein [candidate division KSB1 bacterium]